MFKKNIIIVGCSFSRNKEGWPSMVANNLNLRLIHFGIGGTHWWTIKQFLDNLSQKQIENSEAIVCCHTLNRRPALDCKEQILYQTTKPPEWLEAKKLYHKYLHSQNFQEWVEPFWFKEFSEKFSKLKIINLHCFDNSIKNKMHLRGTNVLPSLFSISCNEIDNAEAVMDNDERKNHFSDENNIVLANAITEYILNYQEADVILDISKFNLLTTGWFD